MTLMLEAIPVPLRDDGHGGWRVGSTRVTFESVWHLHQQGTSPVDIVRAFDTLNEADVCAVLAWALGHTEDVKAYLMRRQEEADQLRRDLEAAGLTPSREESAKLKERLLKRREDQQPRTGDVANSNG